MIKCELCGFEYKSLTASHMRASHGLTLWNYCEKFPNSPLTSPELSSALSDAQHLRFEIFPISESTKLSISQSLDGHVDSLETRFKKSESHLGIPLSETHKESISRGISEYRRKKGFVPLSEFTKERISKSCKLVTHTKEWNEKVSLSCLEYWSSCEGKETLERLVRDRVTPEYRETLSRIRRQMWSEDASYQEAQANAYSNGPNIDEVILRAILESKFPGFWKFVGNGSLMIGGKKPDFVDTETGTLLIELFGYHYHTEEEVIPRIEFFKKFGYRCLVIWDYEIFDKDLASRIDRFRQEVLEEREKDEKGS